MTRRAIVINDRRDLLVERDGLGREGRAHADSKEQKQELLSQNTNASPPRILRGMLMSRNRSPPEVVMGRYPCARRLRSSAEASIRQGTRRIDGTGCRTITFKPGSGCEGSVEYNGPGRADW